MPRATIRIAAGILLALAAAAGTVVAAERAGAPAPALERAVERVGAMGGVRTVHVWRREELYHGPWTGDAPDVVGLCSAGFGVVTTCAAGALGHAMVLAR